MNKDMELCLYWSNFYTERRKEYQKKRNVGKLIRQFE